MQNYTRSTLKLRGKIQNYTRSTLKLRGKMQNYTRSTMKLRGKIQNYTRSTLKLRGKMQNYTRSTLKSPRQCPLVLLVKVAWRQVRASRIKGGIVLRLECCGVRGTGGGMKLSVWREFRIWMAASWRNFDRFGRAAFWRKFSFQFCGRGWHEKRAVRCEVMYLLSFPNQRFKCQLQRAVG